MINIIVAKSENNVIGSKSDLPWYLPADLRHFKEVTMGYTVVMGRKTFESIISRLGKPLPGRKNVVITRDESFNYPGVEVLHDIGNITELGDCFVIGGAEIYNQILPLADRLYVTEIHTYINGDTFFPDIDNQWIEISRETHSAYSANPYDYDFVVYKKLTNLAAV